MSSFNKKSIYFCIFLSLAFLCNLVGIDILIIDILYSIFGNIYKPLYNLYTKILTSILPIILGAIISYLLYTFYTKRNLESHLINYLENISGSLSFMKHNPIFMIKYKIEDISKESSNCVKELSKLGVSSEIINRIRYNINHFESSIPIIESFIDSLSHDIYIYKYKKISPSGLSNHYEIEKRHFSYLISDKIYIVDIIEPDWKFIGIVEGFDINSEFIKFLKNRNIENFKFPSFI